MADPYDDWSPDAHLEQMYEDRFYVPDDPSEDEEPEDPDPDTTCQNCGRAVGDEAVDGVCGPCARDEDPDEDGPTGCANCGHGVGETDDDGLCARCGPVPWPHDATDDD